MGAVAGLGAAFAQGAAPDPDQPAQKQRRQSARTQPPPEDSPPLPEPRS
jgi:hypothetical protein